MDNAAIHVPLLGEMTDGELVQLAALEAEPVHTRRIIHVVGPGKYPGYNKYLAYCTICQWYQLGVLADVMAMWAEHLDQVGQQRSFGKAH